MSLDKIEYTQNHHSTSFSSHSTYIGFIAQFYTLLSGIDCFLLYNLVSSTSSSNLDTLQLVT
jgi:hypothetical protein